MGKNIIICSDGTGNTGIKDRGTNVFKLFEAVDLNGHRTDPQLDPQVALYDDGVGTQGFLPLKLLGGAFGFGLARNVRKLYMELVRIYDPGDRIYLFGFSRGAFTARTLAGMIIHCGVLDRQKLHTSDALRDMVKEAYRTYRRRYRTWLQQLFHNALLKAGQRELDDDILRKFRQHHSVDYDVRIRFIGVWDTVDAVGGPFYTSDLLNALIFRFKFPDQRLHRNVEYACHALAIDEARAAFKPRLWEQDDERIQQVWFAGVHSNVGGGYPKQGMSLVALDWMLRWAERNELRVLASARQDYDEHANVDDKLYDSRAGLGVFYRWRPRDIGKICAEQHAGRPAVVHLSVAERIAHGTDGYNPGSLPDNLELVYTPSYRSGADGQAQDCATAERARGAQAALRTAFKKDGASLEAARPTLWMGYLAYFLYVLPCAWVVAARAVPTLRHLFTPLKLTRMKLDIAGHLFRGEWQAAWSGTVRTVDTQWTTILPFIVFVAAVVLAWYVDHRRDTVFSRFWHDSRQGLREALKSVRRELRAEGGGPCRPSC